MRIHIHYFASLRDESGLEEETIEVESPSLRALFGRLQSRFSFSLGAEHIRPAINDEFCDWTRAMADGDRVVFVPPVSGG